MNDRSAAESLLVAHQAAVQFAIALVRDPEVEALVLIHLGEQVIEPMSFAPSSRPRAPAAMYCACATRAVS